MRGIKVKKSILIFFAIIFLVGIVNAVDTEIKIKTLQNHEVQVSVADGTIVDFSVIQRFKATSDEYGDVSFNLASDIEKINLYVYVKEGNENVITEKYMGYDTGKPISIELAPSWFEFIKTPTTNNTKSDANISSNNSTLEAAADVEPEKELLSNKSSDKKNFILTGLTTLFGKEGLLSTKTFYYIIVIGLIATVVIVAFVFRNKIFGSKILKDIKTKKLSEFLEEKKEKSGYDMKELDEAEKKIKEAQEKISRLRRDEKVRELRNKIGNYENELKRLGG